MIKHGLDKFDPQNREILTRFESIFRQRSLAGKFFQPYKRFEPIQLCNDSRYLVIVGMYSSNEEDTELYQNMRSFIHEVFGANPDDHYDRGRSNFGSVPNTNFDRISFVKPLSEIGASITKFVIEETKKQFDADRKFLEGFGIVKLPKSANRKIAEILARPAGEIGSIREGR